MSEGTTSTTGMAAAAPLTDLRGKAAIVTGASSGIGEAVAELLAQQGARVALAARRTDQLESVRNRLATAAPGGEAMVVECDVRAPDDVQHLVQGVLDRWGQLDILVANAGFGYRSLVVDGDIERWRDLLDTNVYGLLLTLKYGVPPMLARHSGHVVVTSSIAGRVVTPTGGVYCASKAAATAIAEALRMEVSKDGVRVTTLEPGVVISDFQRVAQYPPEVLPNMLKGAEPLVPADIARAVVFALQQPEHVGIHELIIRPAGQTYP